MLEPSAIMRGLRQFNGTEKYTRHYLCRDMVMTDGVVWLREAADCFWLTDAIASHLATNRQLRAVNEDLAAQVPGAGTAAGLPADRRGERRQQAAAGVAGSAVQRLPAT